MLTSNNLLFINDNCDLQRNTIFTFSYLTCLEDVIRLPAEIQREAERNSRFLGKEQGSTVLHTTDSWPAESTTEVHLLKYKCNNMDFSSVSGHTPVLLFYPKSAIKLSMLFLIPNLLNQQICRKINSS